MERLRLKAYGDMQQTLGAARRLGVSEEDIRGMLKEQGVTDATAEELVTGDYTQYSISRDAVYRALQASPSEYKERMDAWLELSTPEERDELLGSLAYSVAYHKKLKASNRDTIGRAADSLAGMGIDFNDFWRPLYARLKAKNYSYETIQEWRNRLRSRYTSALDRQGSSE